MPRRLILHIGYYKTGTTALQDQLGYLRPALERHGVLYPEAGRAVRRNPNHSGLSFQEIHRARSRLPAWYTRSREYSDFLSGTTPPAREELAAEIASSAADTIIVSSEEFILFAQRRGVPVEQTQEMLRALCVDHITLVCYVRRPDHYLESWYNQLVKSSVPVRRLSPTMMRRPSLRHPYYGTPHTDFDRVIDYWAHGVGCNEVIVRSYDQLTDSAIFDDFSDAVNLPPLGNLDIPPVRPNRRIDNNFIEYARVWTLFRPGESHRKLHEILERMADEPKLPRRFDVYLLGPLARRRLHSYFTPVNKRLGRLVGTDTGYFDDLDEMLSVPDESISDVEAFRFWSPYIEIAVRAAGVVR